MNQFVLAFPIPVAVDEPFSITENVQVKADTKTLMIPGCSVQFNVVRQGASADLLEIFKERDEISAEEEAAIVGHKSLLFLLGNVKTMDDVEMVNSAIVKVLNAKAAGVYMQQSGSVDQHSRFERLALHAWPGCVYAAGFVHLEYDRRPGRGALDGRRQLVWRRHSGKVGECH